MSAIIPARAVVAISLLLIAIALIAATAVILHERREPPLQPQVNAAVMPALAALPVLHQGRVKPYQIAAEQIRFAIVGRSRFGLRADGKPATAGDLVADLMLDPTRWQSTPLLGSAFEPLQRALGIDGDFATLDQVDVPAARQLLMASALKAQKERATGELQTQSAVDLAAAQLADRAGMARAALSGHALELAPLITSADQRAWVAGLAPRLGEAEHHEAPWRQRVRALHTVLARAQAGGEATVATVWRTPEADIWLSFADLVLRPDPLLAEWPDGDAVRAAGTALGTALRAGSDVSGPAATLAEALRIAGTAHVAALRGQGAEHLADYPDAGRIALELRYTRLHPFALACVLFVLGGTLSAFALAARAGRWWRILRNGGIALTVLGALLVSGGLVARTVISGWGPVTNLYETLIWVSLVSAVLGLVLTPLTGNWLYAVCAGFGAGICALVGETMPPDLGSHLGQLQPVLRSQFWLLVHVLTVVASYAAFLLAWLMGNIMLVLAVRQGRQVSNGESQVIYRALQVGLVLIAAGTLLGGWWADQAWGRFWGWDPKEVWALVILLVYVVPLHLRYAGAVGPTGLAAWAVIGFLSVVMSWYGVNFLLGAGKHAYATGKGFGESMTIDKVVVLGLSVVQVVVTVLQLLYLRGLSGPPGPKAVDEGPRSA